MNHVMFSKKYADFFKIWFFGDLDLVGQGSGSGCFHLEMDQNFKGLGSVFIWISE